MRTISKRGFNPGIPLPWRALRRCPSHKLRVCFGYIIYFLALAHCARCQSALLADIWDAKTRGKAMAIFTIMPFAGREYISSVCPFIVNERSPCFSRHRSDRGRLHRRRRSIVALAVLGVGDICKSEFLFPCEQFLKGIQRLASVGSRFGSLCRRHMSERYFLHFFGRRTLINHTLQANFAFEKGTGQTKGNRR